MGQELVHCLLSSGSSIMHEVSEEICLTSGQLSFGKITWLQPNTPISEVQRLQR